MIKFFKKETVFCIATLMAIVSCFFAVPSIGYIDFKTLLILFVMMVVVQFLKAIGVFDVLVGRLVGSVSSVRGLVFVLVFACFFGSIIITNDISLLTFVPFAIAAFKKIDKLSLIIPVVALQTIAANMGCMVNPFGSPHDIYLFGAANLSFLSFIGILLPYWIVSLVILVVCCLLIPSSPIDKGIALAAVSVDKRDLVKKTFLGVDYFLLLTFIAFYILIGNLQHIDTIYDFFSHIVTGRELLSSILASQIISNVPAAMFITGFSSSFKEIIVGVNIGGLGTLIASMANLISYKILAHEFNSMKGKYLFVFTVSNVVLLLMLIGVYFIV